MAGVWTVLYRRALRAGWHIGWLWRRGPKAQAWLRRPPMRCGSCGGRMIWDGVEEYVHEDLSVHHAPFFLEPWRTEITDAPE